MHTQLCLYIHRHINKMLLNRVLLSFGLNEGEATAWNQMQLKKSPRKLSETKIKPHNFSVIYHTLLYSNFLSYLLLYQVLYIQESS